MINGRDTILLVDDDADIIWAMSRALSLAGFEVTSCEDGVAACDLMEAQEFDVLITDVMMPRLSGLALLDWVRSNRPGMKTLVMTAFSSSSLEQLSLNSGALLFMQKPADPDLIVQALRSEMSNQVNAGGSA